MNKLFPTALGLKVAIAISAGATVNAVDRSCACHNPVTRNRHLADSH